MASEFPWHLAWIVGTQGGEGPDQPWAVSGSMSPHWGLLFSQSGEPALSEWARAPLGLQEALGVGARRGTPVCFLVLPASLMGEPGGVGQPVPSQGCPVATCPLASKLRVSGAGHPFTLPQPDGQDKQPCAQEEGTAHTRSAAAGVSGTHFFHL